MKEQTIEQLKTVHFFSSLTSSELNQLGGKLSIKNFNKNEIILCEEDTNEFMYIILYGKVKVIQVTEDGKETILAIHQTGDFFGEMSLIDGKTVPATVIAMEDTLTAIISKKDFYSLIFTQNEVLIKLLQILCFRIRRSWEMIQLLNFNNASQRIKTLFTLLSEEYGIKTEEGTILSIKLTHKDIANMTGITRETVTRVIDKWRKEKEIAVLKDRHIRLNPDFLKKI
jgi:CRP/FNR family transcriptional regulator